jgi:hypothetical protein
MTFKERINELPGYTVKFIKMGKSENFNRFSLFLKIII